MRVLFLEGTLLNRAGWALGQHVAQVGTAPFLGGTAVVMRPRPMVLLKGRALTWHLSPRADFPPWETDRDSGAMCGFKPPYDFNVFG